MERLDFRDAGPTARAAGLERLAGAILAGETVAFPTDTVWGIAARADSAEAVARLFRLKERSPERSTPVFVAGLTAARTIFDELPPPLERVARVFWPGGLTLVAAARAGCLDAVRAPDGTIGLRVPAGRLLGELLTRIDVPLACTSANLSGEPPLASASDVAARFGHELALVADHGERAGLVASTVVRWRSGALELLREGAIPFRAILEASIAPIRLT